MGSPDFRTVLLQDVFFHFPSLSLLPVRVVLSTALPPLPPPLVWVAGCGDPLVSLVGDLRHPEASTRLFPSQNTMELLAHGGCLIKVVVSNLMKTIPLLLYQVRN